MKKEVINKGKVVYSDLSYEIVGTLFEVFNEMSYSHKEKYIQEAIANVLKKKGISFKKEVKSDIKFKDDRIGTYFFDFLIEDKIILEIKKRNYFSKKDIEQIFAYLKTANLKLGILAHFTQGGVKYKRIVNLI